MVELPQQPIDIIVDGPDLVLRSGPILDFLNLLDDETGHLLPPFLAFVEIVDFPNVS